MDADKVQNEPAAGTDEVQNAAAGAADPILSAYDRFAQRGHEIIAENLAHAQRLAEDYPVVRLLLPHIEGTLRALFNHMLQGPPAAGSSAPAT